MGYVFDRLSDFAGLEKAALRRGAEVVRTDRMDAAGRGAQWRTQFSYAGKPRRMELLLETYEPPSRMRLELESKNLIGELMVELHELSRGQTRVLVKLRVKPLTMTARVMLQGARLAKGRTVRKMQERMSAYAREIEERYQKERAA